MDAALSVPPPPPTAEVQAAVHASAARTADADEVMPISVPTMDQLDSAWDDDEEEAESEAADAAADAAEEASEPELPDERLDPAAYLAAKLAREERLEARRERRRAKVDAKKARRRARADAAKGKQKGKTKKVRPPATAKASSSKLRAASPRERDADARNDSAPDEDLLDAALPSPMSARARASKPRISTNTWMLALAVGVLLAAAVAAAVIFR
jgi:cobalamin biosynthesis Mg chelatase CobN